MPLNEKQLSAEICELKTLFMEKQKEFKEDITKLSEKLDALITVLNDKDCTMEQTANPVSLVNYFETNYSHLRDMGKHFIKEEGYNIRRSHLKMWRNLLNQRKLAYYNAIKCRGLSERFREFYEQEEMYIPKKFREKITQQDTETQRRIKMDLSVSRFVANIKILEDKIVHYTTKYLEIDEELKAEITTQCPVSTHSFLFDLWEVESKAEEEKSKSIWLKKDVWIKDLPNHEKKQEMDKLTTKKKRLERKKQQENIRKKQVEEMNSRISARQPEKRVHTRNVQTAEKHVNNGKRSKTNDVHVRNFSYSDIAKRNVEQINTRTRSNTQIRPRRFEGNQTRYIGQRFRNRPNSSNNYQNSSRQNNNNNNFLDQETRVKQPP